MLDTELEIASHGMKVPAVEILELGQQPDLRGFTK